MSDRKPVKLKTPNVRKVIDISRKPAKVEADTIAEALGAAVVTRDLPSGLPPAQHFQLFERIAEDIVSTGGRPGRKEVTERKKIPLTKAEWSKLQKIAEDCKQECGISVSPAQIGGLLVREGLRAYASPGQEVDELMAAASQGKEVAKLRPVAEMLVRRLEKSQEQHCADS